MKDQHHSDSPLVRFLRDPEAPLRHALSLLDHAAATALHAAPVLAAIAGVLLLARIVLALVQERLRVRGARLIRIGVPPEVDAGGGALLWSGLHALLRPRLARLLAGQPQLAWEISGGVGGSSFRLWVPGQVPPGLVERALAAAWPGVSLDTTPAEQDAGVPAGVAYATVEFALSGPDWFPLAGTEGADPLRLVLGQLADLELGEGALVQLMARPATIRERARLHAAARRIRAGIPTSRIVRLLDLLQSRPAQRPALDPTINPDVRAVLEKAAYPLYRCALRLVVCAGSRKEARGRIHALAGAFAAYEGRVGLRRRRGLASRRKLARRTLGRPSFLLSIPELAALCHLPTEQALPGLLRAGARTVAPPPGLPGEGKPLGRAASGQLVFLTVADARYHLHLLGPTGVGKSTLIALLVLCDFLAGRGAVVVDPKGDLVEEILARIPKGFEDRVDLLDPLDPVPPGLNVLEGDDNELVVDQLVAIFRRVYERFWGPRTDDILRAALLTLTQPEVKGATLADVPRLLTDTKWRSQLLLDVDDQRGLEPFWDWYHGLGETARAQATGPVLNKLRAFLLRRAVREVVGQQRSTIDIARCLDQGRLLLVKLPKGTLGEDTSRLLGSFVVARVWQAALARAGRPEAERPDSALYIDEVHNYLTLPTPLEEMLAEARSYRLSLCLAHQHLAQLDREMRDAFAANARTKLYFQLPPEDAAALERQVEPELGAHDLAHLPRHSAAVRICHAGQTQPAFTLTTQPLPAADPGRAEAVRGAVRARLAAEREQAETPSKAR